MVAASPLNIVQYKDQKDSINIPIKSRKKDNTTFFSKRIKFNSTVNVSQYNTALRSNICCMYVQLLLMLFMSNFDLFKDYDNCSIHIK